MTSSVRPPYWSGSRIFAYSAAALVVLVFVGANAHLIAVSFASNPDCVLQPVKEGAVSHRAAKSSC